MRKKVRTAMATATPEPDTTDNPPLISRKGNIMTKSTGKTPSHRSTKHDSPGEVALDEANEMSFPASDPVSTSNITRITKAPVLPEAAADHQNSNKIKKSSRH